MLLFLLSQLTRTLRPQFVGDIATKARKKATARKVGTITLSVSELKKAKRAAQKAFEKYHRRCNGILDIVRSVLRQCG